MMKYFGLSICFFFLSSSLCAQETILKKSVLQDKIKGGWAGQTIGVTFGGPYEFQFQGTFIGDYQPLFMPDSAIVHAMKYNAGLYDDLYMDITFVDVMNRYGLHAPVDSFENAFAHAGYMLWHANQAARYNLLNGIKAPESGFWKNNPHADCIDYQIESDFAGLMSPGMPAAAATISDKIGHIMNYGDGWYGGVFVSAMYSYAFINNNIPGIISKALELIPHQSEFYQCIHDVIGWHKSHPDDWKQTWLKVQEKWANDIGCPEGVFKPFNIDAKVNAAYVVMGLLYGKGDYSKSLDVTTRCGQDADCNPSTVGGILGTIMGYDNIPGAWKQFLSGAEDIPFKYTTMALNDVYRVGFHQALQNIVMNGGDTTGENVRIQFKAPHAVKFEKSFDGLIPQKLISPAWVKPQEEIKFSFDGTGFVIKGDVSEWDGKSEYVYRAVLTVDDKNSDTIPLPVAFATRRYELAWKYDLPAGHHDVSLRFLNPSADYKIRVGEAISYGDKRPSSEPVLRK